MTPIRAPRASEILLPLAVAVFAIVAWLRVDLFGAPVGLALLALAGPLVLSRLLGASDRGAVFAGLVGLAALTYAQVLAPGDEALTPAVQSVRRPMVSPEVLPADRPWTAPRSLELLTPAVFERPDPGIPGLASRAFLGHASGPRGLLVWIGLGPALLALVGLAEFHLRRATGAALLLLAGLAATGFLGPRWTLTGQWATLALSATFAGLGYTRLARPLPSSAGPPQSASSTSATSARTGALDPRPSVGPEMIAAILSVAATGALALAAATAGVGTDAQALAPVLERLSAAPDPGHLLANAAHLRRVLDAGALAAFAVMTALLIHLKARRESSLAVLTLVIIAELLLVPAAVL